MSFSDGADCDPENRCLSSPGKETGPAWGLGRVRLGLPEFSSREMAKHTSGKRAPGSLLTLVCVLPSASPLLSSTLNFPTGLCPYFSSYFSFASTSVPCPLGHCRVVGNCCSPLPAAFSKGLFFLCFFFFSHLFIYFCVALAVPELDQACLELRDPLASVS